MYPGHNQVQQYLGRDVTNKLRDSTSYPFYAPTIRSISEENVNTYQLNNSKGNDKLNNFQQAKQITCLPGKPVKNSYKQTASKQHVKENNHNYQISPQQNQNNNSIASSSQQVQAQQDIGQAQEVQPDNEYLAYLTNVLGRDMVFGTNKGNTLEGSNRSGEFSQMGSGQTSSQCMSPCADGRTLYDKADNIESTSPSDNCFLELDYGGEVTNLQFSSKQEVKVARDVLDFLIGTFDIQNAANPKVMTFWNLELLVQQSVPEIIGYVSQRIYNQPAAIFLAHFFTMVEMDDVLQSGWCEESGLGKFHHPVHMAKYLTYGHQYRWQDLLNQISYVHQQSPFLYAKALGIYRKLTYQCQQKNKSVIEIMSGILDTSQQQGQAVEKLILAACFYIALMLHQDHVYSPKRLAELLGLCAIPNVLDEVLHQWDVSGQEGKISPSIVRQVVHIMERATERLAAELGGNFFNLIN